MNLERNDPPRRVEIRCIGGMPVCTCPFFNCRGRFKPYGGKWAFIAGTDIPVCKGCADNCERVCHEAATSEATC